MRIFLFFSLMIGLILHAIGCAMADNDEKRVFSFMSIGFGVLCWAVFIIMDHINIV